MSGENDVQDLDDQLLGQMLRDFLEEAAGCLDQLNLNLIQLEQEPSDETLVVEVFRIVHTLKGSAGFVGLSEISEVSRKMEEVLGAVREGALNLTPQTVRVLYEGLDVLVALKERAAAGDDTEVDISGILHRMEGILGNTIMEFVEEPIERKTGSLDPHELLSTYRASYDQLAALKHIVYSSVHLSDPESLAVLFSKQIDERMSAERNAVWMMDGHHRIVEIARNGELVEQTGRRVLDVESSEVLKRVIHEQLVVWPSSLPQVKEVLPEFQSPTLFPIKGQPEAFGFLVLDPEETAEVEVYQFVGQFAAMMFNISKLHQKVEEQREELNEMTEILFKQNAQLSSLHHVELDLMKVSDPVELCRIVVEAIVDELGALRAAAFLIDDASRKLIGVSESAGLQGITSMRLPIEGEAPIKHAIESGRVVTYRDYPEQLRLGLNQLENWVVLCLKGNGRPQGILVTEIEDEDAGDAIAVLANYSGILLDNLMLQKKVGDGISEV